MIIQHIYIDKYGWYLIVFYIIDFIDKAEILDVLESIDCDPLIIEGVEYNIDHDFKNSGVTFTSDKYRTSVIMIGPTTTADEFQNSYDHEKGHLVMHLSKVFDIDPYGEELQYLNGVIGEEMFPVAQYFLCDNCRKKLYEE